MILQRCAFIESPRLVTRPSRSVHAARAFTRTRRGRPINNDVGSEARAREENVRIKRVDSTPPPEATPSGRKSKKTRVAL